MRGSMTARFEIVTGEGALYGPFTLQELREFVEQLPSWICWEVRIVGV